MCHREVCVCGDGEGALRDRQIDRKTDRQADRQKDEIENEKERKAREGGSGWLGV